MVEIDCEEEEAFVEDIIKQVDKKYPNITMSILAVTYLRNCQIKETTPIVAILSMMEQLCETLGYDKITFAQECYKYFLEESQPQVVKN